MQENAQRNDNTCAFIDENCKSIHTTFSNINPYSEIGKKLKPEIWNIS